MQTGPVQNPYATVPVIRRAEHQLGALTDILRRELSMPGRPLDELLRAVLPRESWTPSTPPCRTFYQYSRGEWEARRQLHDAAGRALGHAPQGGERAQLATLDRLMLGISERVVPRYPPAPIDRSSSELFRLWADAAILEMMESAGTPFDPRALGKSFTRELPVPPSFWSIPGFANDLSLHIVGRHWQELLRTRGMVGTCKVVPPATIGETSRLVLEGFDERVAAGNRARARQEKRADYHRSLGFEPSPDHLETGNRYVLQRPGTARLPDMDGQSRDPERRDEYLSHRGRIRELETIPDAGALDWLDGEPG